MYALQQWRDTVSSIIKTLLPFQAAAWKVSSEPIQQMLSEPNGGSQDRLTAVWRKSTQAQLNTISITVRADRCPLLIQFLILISLQSALFGGVIATSYTWPALAQMSVSVQTTIKAIWYSALMLALASIATSTQQAIFLSRLGSHPEGLRKTREVLGRCSETGAWKPSRVQLMVWQAPLSLLNSSVVLYVAGLVALVWNYHSALIRDNVKVSLTSASAYLNIMLTRVGQGRCLLHIDPCIYCRTLWTVSLRIVPSDFR